MSWSIYARGSKNAVARIVAEQADTKYDDAKSENTQQKKACAALIIGEINRLNFTGNYNTVSVEASGHLHAGEGNLSIKIFQERFHLDEPPAPVTQTADSLAAAALAASIAAEGKPGTPDRFGQTLTIATPAEQGTPSPAGIVDANEPANVKAEACPDCGQDVHTRGCPRY